jgi:TonB family protein
MTEQAATLPRQGKDASFPFLIFLSILGHLLIVLLAISIPQIFTGGNPVAFGGPSGSGGLDVMTVDLGRSISAPASKKKAPEEEPAPSRYISKVNKEPDVPLESKTSLPDPDKKKKEKEPEAKATLNQKERKTEGTFGTGKNTKEEQKPGSTGSGKFGIGTFGAGQGGPGGFGTGTGIEFPFPWYIESVLTKIELNWAKPFISDTTPRQYITIVYFVISRVGKVSNVKVEQSSGVPALDRSAEAAVLGAAPLPPLPNQWTEPELAFRVTFTYTK